MGNLEELVGCLRQHGLRVTRQREAVLSVLCQAPGAMSPHSIYVEAHKSIPELGLATVYRTLEVLQAGGWLRRVHEPDGGEKLVVGSSSHGHHVLCTDCGVVAEFSTCLLADTIDGAGRETGFSIKEHHLELLGLCRECARRAEAGGR